MIRVLIVEDDPMVARINKRYVESVEGFEVIGVAVNGNDALSFLKSNSVDLVVLDIYMPKMDGIRFIREMRRDGIMTDVIFVTAARDSGLIDEALTLGAFDYLIKPFEYERLKKSLENFALKYRLLKDKSEFMQEDIDKITNKGTADYSTFLQKGLNSRTLIRIKEFMSKNSDRFITSEEVAESMRLSRVTTRRYLEYLVSIGELISEVEYGSVGRPGHLYKYSGKVD